MCGIFGAYIPSPDSEKIESLISARDSIAHRGPDSSGYWLSSDNRLFLSHRRLAIIDLSTAGHQPMHSGKYSIVFNGEIYNYQEIKKELHDAALSADSGDTATMLAAFENFGIEKAIEKFSGMFAFALWDAKEETLTLARDRLGEKPLYYGWAEGKFFFSSEPIAILKALKDKVHINRSALGHLSSFGYVPCPLSIFEGIYKLPPACILKLKVQELKNKPDTFSEYPDSSAFSPKRYWSIKETSGKPETISEADYINQLETLLKRSVSEQMIADVPLGAFLSGGIDSSMIVAMMQTITAKPVKTFSIGFSTDSFNEAPFAKAVANHLKTDHTELYVDEKQALDVVPEIPKIFSEPFADASQIPTYLVSKLTRQFVTVSLSGDGGDELFGGYERYIWAERLWRYISQVPEAGRNMLGKLANQVPTAFIDSFLHSVNPVLPKSFRLRNAGIKIQRALSIGSVSSASELYLIFLSQKYKPAEVINGFYPSNTALDSTTNWLQCSNIYNQFMAMDLQNYMPDDIFVKVDRASMAVALESRAPFLDYRLAEFAFSLPVDLKIRNGNKKYILKKLLSRYVPEELTDRPKMGFGVPVASWLCGALRPWAEDLLSEKALRESGFLNVKLVRHAWELHLKGNYSNQYFLWYILMLQAWLREYTRYISFA